MIHPCINNEFSQLEQVVLGIAKDFGGCPTLSEAYDPKSKQHIIAGTFPKEADIQYELQDFASVLFKHDVNIVYPQSVFNCNQIFTRDVGFVIEDVFFVSNMITKRRKELLGFEFLLEQINTSKIHRIPQEVYVEGGDVIVSENHLFIGYSKNPDFHKYEVSRTNDKALVYLQSHFPSKQIIGFELNKSDTNSNQNCLHLDCCFQPLGLGHVIIYPDGFKQQRDIHRISSIFGEENLIFIDKNEMNMMFSNVFSISNNVIVSDKAFLRLNDLLRTKGYLVEEISFTEISKMGGLLRCATLPLKRKQ